MPFRCPGCHHFSDQRGHFKAHMKPRPYNCEGCDLLTDAEKDPDSNCITKQGCEEARKREEEVQAKQSAQASAAMSEPRLRLKDIEIQLVWICSSNEENECLLTDWKTHAQTLLSQHNPLLLGKAFPDLCGATPSSPALPQRLPEFMRWKEFAGHLDHESAGVLNFCGGWRARLRSSKRLAPCQPSTRKSRSW
eukprot:jgi/Astpho2/3513/Aster-06427